MGLTERHPRTMKIDLSNVGAVLCGRPIEERSPTFMIEVLYFLGNKILLTKYSFWGIFVV